MKWSWSRTAGRVAVLAALVLMAGSAMAAGSEDVAANVAAKGLILTSIWVFGLGILVSVTPCLYPMIPVTLSVIGARNVGQKPVDGFLRALTFVLGIATVYTVLGIAATAAGRSISFVLQWKSVWVVLALFFVVMGLSMMGWFTMQIPAGLAGKLQGSAAGRKGFGGAFFLGLVTGVVASPCGSPVLAGLAAYAAGEAARGSYFGSVVLFFAYAMGIGVLFLVLGTAPALMTRMPKAGGWMEDVKKLLGGVLIGIGIYYLKYGVPVNSALLQALYWTLVVATFLVAAAVLAVVAGQRRRYPILQQTWRALAAALVIGACYVGWTQTVPSYLVRSKTVAATATAGSAKGSMQAVEDATPPSKPIDMISAGRSAVLDQQKYADLLKAGNAGKTLASGSGGRGDAATANSASSVAGAGSGSQAKTAASAAPKEDDDWLTNEPIAIAAATKAKTPVLVDFTANWCGNCKKLEAKTFTDPAVAQEMSRFLKLRVDVTDDTDENKALTQKYGANTFPTIAFIDANGKRHPDLDLKDYEGPKEFLERLKKVSP